MAWAIVWPWAGQVQASGGSACPGCLEPSRSGEGSGVWAYCRVDDRLVSNAYIYADHEKRLDACLDDRQEKTKWSRNYCKNEPSVAQPFTVGRLLQKRHRRVDSPSRPYVTGAATRVATTSAAAGLLCIPNLQTGEVAFSTGANPERHAA